MRNISTLLLKGGRGSGNFGHAGRPGQIGGSGTGGGKVQADVSYWQELRKREEHGRSTEEETRIAKRWEEKFKKTGMISKDGKFTIRGFPGFENKNIACKSLIDTHNEMINTFPILKKYMKESPLKSLALSGESNLLPFQDEQSSWSLSGGLYCVGARLYTSKGHDFDGDWGEKKLRLGDGSFNVDYTGRGIYRHEIGHHIHYLLENNKRIIFDSIYNNLSLSQVRDGVSIYAASKKGRMFDNSNECFAESFCAYVHPNYGKEKTLPKELHDFFVKEFPKKEISKVKSLSEYLIKGGSGSGNFGHAGRPGVVGGSGTGGVGGSVREEKKPLPDSEKELLEMLDKLNEKYNEKDKESEDKFKEIGIISKDGVLNLRGFYDLDEQERKEHVQHATSAIYDAYKDIKNYNPLLQEILQKNPLTHLNVSGEGSVDVFESYSSDIQKYTLGMYRYFKDKSIKRTEIFTACGSSHDWNFEGNLDFGKDLSSNQFAKSIFRHELGHHIENILKNKTDSMPKIKGIWIDFQKSVNRFDDSFEKNKIKNKISVYAATDIGECFAECFSLYTHPDYGKKLDFGKTKRVLPEELHDFFTTNFPKNKKTKSLSGYLIEVKGGAGSGNFGHAGRPGQIGGSGTGGAGSVQEGRNKLRDVIDNAVQSLKDPSSNPNIKLWSDARKEVYEFAKSKEGRKRETIILSVRGENIRIEGTRSEVGIPMSMLRKSEYTIHNHPGSSPPSAQDLITFMDCPNMKVMEIITSDGTVHRLTKDSNNPNIRKKWIGSEFEKIEEKLHPIYREKVNKSRSNIEEIRIQEESEVNRLLAKKLGIKYEVKNISNIKFMVNMKKARVYTIQEGEEVYILDDSNDNRNPLLEYIEREDKKKAKSLSEYLIKGGAGSGNFGHAGRPGVVGGSGSGGGSGSINEEKNPLSESENLFTWNNEDRIAFHGTNQEAIDSILKNGILSGEELNKRQWKEDYYQWERKDAVFITTDESTALMFAEQAALNSKYNLDREYAAIFKVKISKEVKVNSDEKLYEGGYFINSNIPSSWIQGLSIYKKNKLTGTWDIFASSKEKKFIGNIYYVPIMFKKSKEKSLSEYLIEVKGGRGSGNFGHSGRPGQVGGSGTGVSGSVQERKLNEKNEVFILGREFNVNKRLSKLKLTQEDVVNAISLPGVSATITIRIDEDAYKGLVCTADYKKGEKDLGYAEVYFDDTDYHVGLIEFNSKVMDKGYGKKIIEQAEEMCKKSGTKQLSLEADISIGRYAWAGMGFEYRNPYALEESKKRLSRYIDSHIKEMNVKFTSEKREEIQKQIDSCTGVKDIAYFKVPELVFTRGQLKDSFRNKDVPKDMPMDIGKSFMLNLDIKGHGAWIGVKKLDSKKSLSEYLVKGGAGSGNFGHAGRPGQIGGSGTGGSGSVQEGRKPLRKKKKILRDISMSSIKKQMEGISQTYHAKKVRKTFDSDLFALDHSLPKNKLIKEVESRLNKDLKGADVCIRMKTWCLEELLFDKAGRIKSQFEVKSSTGIYNEEMRSRMERQILNNKRFNMKNSPDTATIYGYLSKKAGDAFDAMVSSYGENTIVLKKEVRERTTFTSCDSLQNCWSDDSIPSPINNPSIYSVSHLKLLEGKPAVGAMEKIFKVHGRDISYYEAQIHGRVKISDIEKIYLTKDKFQEDTIKKISKKLDVLKIPYEWMKKEEFVGGGRITY